MNQVDSLESLRLWESQEVQEVRNAFEQSQKLLAQVRQMDQTYRDQSQAAGEVAVHNVFHTLSRTARADESSVTEGFGYSALLRANGESKLSTSPSKIEDEDGLGVTQSFAGRYPGGEYTVTAEGNWEARQPKMHAQLDLANGLLSWKR